MLGGALDCSLLGSGMSPAAGFVARMMAENKLKHSGKYKKPTAPAHKDSKMKQWIPFDYANQSGFNFEDQPDIAGGRYGDWRRAPQSWRGYNPAHDDYQIEGNCRRKIFRCLNVGTRTRQLNEQHIREAFSEAESCGSAILAFANHDYRDMISDLRGIKKLIKQIKKEYKSVDIKFSGAESAARELIPLDLLEPDLKFHIEIVDNVLSVGIDEGSLFGPQPYLAIKSLSGNYFHDNFDVVIPKKKFSYTFDDATIPLCLVDSVGVGSSGKYGHFEVKTLRQLGSHRQ
jgi:hypothetical protein